MEINPYIFRGYDIRGVIGDDLTEEIVETIGKAYGTWLQKYGIKDAVVGSDCRNKSEEFRAAVIKGMVSTGVNVIDLGMALVEMVYFAQYHFNTMGAVMVTASHNPAEYNGFKMAKGLSSTLEAEDMIELRDIALKGEFLTGEGKVVKEEILDTYIDKVLEKINITKKFKVAVDYNNGTAAKFFPKLAERIGLEVIPFHDNIDGNFPNGTPDPTDKDLVERLASETVNSGADLGMTFDADGDRIGVVDDKGTVLWNDMLVAIFADDVIENNPGAKIVYNALCSRAVDDVIAKKGGQPVMWMTGHSYIKAKTKEEKALFAGELSGHFFFVDKFYGHDDGFYAALRLLEYLSRRGKKFSEVLKEFPEYISSPEIKVGCPDDVKFDVVKRMLEDVRKRFPEAKITDIDGVRVDFPDGMFIIRASQNGPYAGPKFEAKTREKYEEIKDIVREMLKSVPEMDWSFGVNVESLEPGK